MSYKAKMRPNFVFIYSGRSVMFESVTSAIRKMAGRMNSLKNFTGILKIFRFAAIAYACACVGLIAVVLLIKQSEKAEQPVFFCGVTDSYTEIDESLTTVALTGKSLFKANCSACHTERTEVLVGPGLAGIGQRRKKAWLRKWIRNPREVMNKGDKYAIALFEKFNKVEMKGFPEMTDKEIDAILEYIRESDHYRAYAINNTRNIP